VSAIQQVLSAFSSAGGGGGLAPLALDGRVLSRLGGHVQMRYVPTAVIFDELWPGTAGAALPGAWGNQSGTPTQNGFGAMQFAGAGQTTRNVGVADSTLTFNVEPDNNYPYMLFRSNAAGTHYSVLVIRGDTNLLEFHEFDGSSSTNIVTGSTFITLGTMHTVQVILGGASVTVKLDGSTELTATQAINLTNTYCGIGWVAPPFSATYVFGEVKAQ
jgi:hypothetical protein